MSYSKIKQTFDKRLKAFFTSGDAGLTSIVYYENTEVNSVPKQTFLTSHLMMGEPKQASLGEDAQNKHTGIYQININTPINVGTGPALSVADSIVSNFKRGLRLDGGGFEITIEKSYISISTTDETHYTVPVTIKFYSYI